MAHVIRLRGFWTVTACHGGHRHVRNFGRPGRLEAGERVWLVCSQVPGAADVSVNGQIVAVRAEAGAFEVDVTEQLAGRNTVAFAIRSTEPLEEVTLEVRS